MTAQEDHPALRGRRRGKDNEALVHLPPAQRRTDDTPTTPTLSSSAEHQHIEDEGEEQQLELVEEAEEKEVVEGVEEEVEEEMEVVEVYERAEVLAAISSWLSLVSERSRAPWSEGEGEERTGPVLEQTAVRLDPFHQFDWTDCRTHRGRAMTVVSGARNRLGRLHGKMRLVFSSGEEVEGTFYQGRREGPGRISSRSRGLSSLTGRWSQDRLGGLVEVEYTDGCRAQGWVNRGVWHGAFRSFHPGGELAVLGRCRNGRLTGRCWKFFQGGGALYGEVGRDGLICGEEALYVYPDWLTGIQVRQILLLASPLPDLLLLQGSFKAEKLIAGVKVRVSKASLTRGSFLHLEVCRVKQWGESHYFRYRESTQHQIAEHPLVPDIYESKTVSCKKSR